MAALGAHQQAHRHASHRTGHHNGNRRTTMRRQHADIEHVDRSGGHARAEHQQDVRVLQNHASAHALPHPRDRNLPCKSAARQEHGEQDRLTGDLRTGGRTTRGPLRGRLPPPSKGGSKGPGWGSTPPITPSPAWNQQLPNRCTSHSPASSSPAAGVEYFHPQTI